MLLSPAEEAEIEEIVESTAKRYLRKCWWANASDLRQQGHLAVVVARRSYDPAEGRGGPYFGRAVKRSMSNFLIIASSPASSSWHDRFKTIGLKRVGEDDPEAAGAFEGEDQGWADRLLDDRRRRVRLLSRLYEVVGAEGRPGLEALLAEQDGEKYRRGRVPARLQESINLARKRIAGDNALFSFLRD